MVKYADYTILSFYDEALLIVYLMSWYLKSIVQHTLPKILSRKKTQLKQFMCRARESSVGQAWPKRLWVYLAGWLCWVQISTKVWLSVKKKLAVLSSNLDQSLANNKSYSGCLRRPQSGWATHATDEREPAIEKLAVLSSNFDQGLAVCQKKLAVLSSNFDQPLSNKKSYSGW